MRTDICPHSLLCTTKSTIQGHVLVDKLCASRTEQAAMQFPTASKLAKGIQSNIKLHCALAVHFDTSRTSMMPVASLEPSTSTFSLFERKARR